MLFLMCKKLLLENHLLLQKRHESLQQKLGLKVHLTDCITQQGANCIQTL